MPDEQQEDRIRSITAKGSDEGGDFGKHSKSPLQSTAPRPGKISECGR